MRTPARLRALLTGWVIEADTDAAARRRKDAQAEASVDYRRRDDGLADLFATGLTGPNAQAVLSRIRAHSSPVGPFDDRPAGQRRLDALVDLVLGRDRHTLDGELGTCPSGHDTAGCGCPVGAVAPCGTDVQVLIPLGAALGATGELAELVGHGPLDPALTSALLLAAPFLRPVWVDDSGVPVATGRAVERPARDIRGLAAALRRLAASRPGTFVPRHPDDHTGRTHDDQEFGAATLGAATLGQPPAIEPALTQPAGGPQLRSRPHPTGTPGPYRVPAGLRRLLEIRRPLCEWPGCGARACCCDMDHDLAWPHGPTCGCNLGPLCRRHHRIKQLGWTKTRTSGAGVRWTSPTGRSWTSPTPHSPPAAPDRSPPRRLSPPPEDDDGDEDDWPDDPAGLELRADDTEPADDHDRTGEHIQHTDTRWSLELDNPYLWLPEGSG